MNQAHATTDIRSSIAQADGAYKVYLAVCADATFTGRFSCTRDGVQYLDNRKMHEPDYALLAVHLAKDWRVVVSREDLKAGIMAASTTIEPRLVYGTSVSVDFTEKVREFLSLNPPSFRRYDITTDAVAAFVDPEGFRDQQRLMEMKISKALRSFGLQKVRISHKGERKMRWFPIDGP